MTEHSEGQLKLWARQAAVDAALTPVNGQLPLVLFYKRDRKWQHSLANSVAGAVITMRGGFELIDLAHLAGREAQCANCANCKTIVPSSPNLAFFEYLGENSVAALTRCKCGYNLSAHCYSLARVNPEPIKCSRFTAHGAYEYDRYYCGCRGWD